MLRSDDRVSDLLHAGARVLIYAGDQDLSCNWVGNRRWVDALEWDGHTAWAETLDQEWGDDWGEGREAEGLTFLRIYDSVSFRHGCSLSVRMTISVTSPSTRSELFVLKLRLASFSIKRAHSR